MCLPLTSSYFIARSQELVPRVLLFELTHLANMILSSVDYRQDVKNYVTESWGGTRKTTTILFTQPSVLCRYSIHFTYAMPIDMDWRV